jgi:hypothetical protein
MTIRVEAEGDLLGLDLDWVVDVVEIDVFDGHVSTPSLTAT